MIPTNPSRSEVNYSNSVTYKYSDPLSMPHLSETMLRDRSCPNGIFVEPPGFERQFLRFSPEFIDDPGGTGLFSGLSTAIYSSPANFVCAISDAVYVGYRTTLVEDHFFLDQSLGNSISSFLTRFGAENSPFNENTGLYRQDASDGFRLDIGPRKTRHLELTAVGLSSTEPSNYGSFLFRILPKIVSLKKCDLLDIPVIVYTGHSSYADLLELAGIKRSNIISHHPNSIVTVVDRLIIPSMRNPGAFLDYESRSLFREISHSFGQAIQKGRRIYVSRFSHANKGRSTRIMLNEEELIESLLKIGIEIVEPENLSLQEQVKIFSSAEMVIGPSGGAMFNTVFCRPGTRVIDIESESHWIYAHTGLFSSNELRYGIFVGEQNSDDQNLKHRSWRVNINALLERIKRFSQN